MARNRTATAPQTDENAAQTDENAAPQTDENTAENTAAENGAQTDASGPQTDENAAPAEPGISLDFITGGCFTLAPELAKTSEPKRERNPKQRAMDERVTSLHTHWAQVGKPSTWGKLVDTKCVTTYFIEPEKVADFKKLVNRAGSFHNLRIRYGSSFQATAELVKRHNLPAEYEGREGVSFAVMSRRPRAANGTGQSGSEVADQVNDTAAENDGDSE